MLCSYHHKIYLKSFRSATSATSVGRTLNIFWALRFRPCAARVVRRSKWCATTTPRATPPPHLGTPTPHPGTPPPHPSHDSHNHFLVMGVQFLIFISGLLYTVQDVTNSQIHVRRSGMDYLCRLIYDSCILFVLFVRSYYIVLLLKQM